MGVVELKRARNVVYCIEGMRHFGTIASEALGWELIVGGYIGDCDTVLIVGMYDAPDYITTLTNTQRAKRRIIHWCGTDVLMLAKPEMLPEALHLCDSDNLRDELFAKGVDATTVMWPTKLHVPCCPLPEVKQVACYLGSDPSRYGVDILSAIGDALAKNRPEVKVVGYVYDPNTTVEDLENLVRESTVHCRFTEHDGSGASPREFMAAGRRAVVTYDLPHATRVRYSDVAGAYKAVCRALDAPEADAEASLYWWAQNSTERYLKQMRDLGVVR